MGLKEARDVGKEEGKRNDGDIRGKEGWALEGEGGNVTFWFAFPYSIFLTRRKYSYSLLNNIL